MNKRKWIIFLIVVMVMIASHVFAARLVPDGSFSDMQSDLSAIASAVGLALIAIMAVKIIIHMF